VLVLIAFFSKFKESLLSCQLDADLSYLSSYCIFSIFLFSVFYIINSMYVCCHMLANKRIHLTDFVCADGLNTQGTSSNCDLPST